MKHKIGMTISRRQLCLLAPMLAASSAYGAEETTLTSQARRFEDLKASKGKASTFREILKGKTHEGCSLEVHETDLAPGAMPHPPHHHANEEMFFIREGAVEVTIAGKKTWLGPGGAAFVASNDEHGIRNAGSTHAQYFVIEIGAGA